MSRTAETIAKQLLKCFKRGNKCLVFGNGGSAQQANHFAAELVHEGLPCVSLNSDISVVTATANDFSYSEIFSRQLLALGKRGDVAIGFSTSGKSANVILGLATAKNMGLEIVDFPRRGPTPRCQEFQLRQLHKIWEFIREQSGK